MRYRVMVVVSICLMASVAAAQSTLPATDKSDSWARPAPASSAVIYRSDVQSVLSASNSPFRFKSKDGYRPGDQPPPSATDKAAVMGADRPWQSGQSPLNCAQSPHSAGC